MATRGHRQHRIDGVLSATIISCVLAAAIPANAAHTEKRSAYATQGTSTQAQIFARGNHVILDVQRHAGGHTTSHTSGSRNTSKDGWHLSHSPTRLPAGDYIQRGFDPPTQRWLAGHRGVDIASSLGESVLAPAGGIVRFAGVIAGAGVVSIDHIGGVHSTYQPVEPAVALDDVVLPHSVIGYVTAGSHCLPSPCLHWGAVRDDEYINPLIVFRVFPRLLPLGP